jgi:hypothetical protein
MIKEDFFFSNEVPFEVSAIGKWIGKLIEDTGDMKF